MDRFSDYTEGGVTEKHAMIMTLEETWMAQKKKKKKSDINKDVDLLVHWDTDSEYCHKDASPFKSYLIHFRSYIIKLC